MSRVDDENDIDENKINDFDNEINNYQSNFSDENLNEENYEMNQNNKYNIYNQDIEEDENNPYSFKNPNLYTLEEKYNSNNNNNNDIQELVSNYNNLYSTTGSPKNAYIEYEKRSKASLDTENYVLKLQDENNRLINKIEEYQKLNKDWEHKVASFKNILLEVEDKNRVYRDEIERLKEESEFCQFKLKLAIEKEKIHENNLKNFKDLQIEYDAKTNEIKREYKAKEETLKKRYDNLEEMVNKRLKENESELTEKIEKLQHQLKDSNKINEKIEKENNVLRDQNMNLERFIQNKEDEFEEIVQTKDRKLKELEQCIKSISDDANSQINKLSESVMEFNDKISYYKNREVHLMQEFVNLKNKVANNMPDPGTPMMSNNNYKDRNRDKSSNSINSYEIGIDSKKVIEKLRTKIKQLEEENMV